MSTVAAKGAWGTVEWATDSNGAMPAMEVYAGLGAPEKAKILSLFQRLAEFGAISNREKFRQLGEKAGAKGRNLWEFKDHQRRFIGDFRPGRRFVVAHGITDKKQNELRKADIEIAVRSGYGRARRQRKGRK